MKKLSGKSRPARDRIFYFDTENVVTLLQKLKGSVLLPVGFNLEKRNIQKLREVAQKKGISVPSLIHKFVVAGLKRGK